MELNISNLSDFVKNAKILFLKGLDSIPMTVRNSGLFRMDPIAKNSGNTKEYSEIDVQQYARRKGQSAQAERATVVQGYSKIGTLYRVALDIGISYEMRSQNKYPEVVAKLTNLGAQANRRLELDLSHRIGFGSATTYTDMDGQTVDISVGDELALFSTVHELKGTTGTFRNILANNPQFSKGSLEGMEKLVVEETLNQMGEKLTLSHDILFSTDDPNTVNTIREHLRSTASPDAINSGVVNVNAGKFKHVILPLIATDAAGAVDSDKAKFWGIASSMGSQAFLGMAEEPRLKSPAEGNNGEEFSTDDWNFGVRAGWFIVIAGANWIKVSYGDGTA